MKLTELTDQEIKLQQELLLKYDKLALKWATDLSTVIAFILTCYDFSKDEVVEAFRKSYEDRDNAIILATYLLNYDNIK